MKSIEISAEHGIATLRISRGKVNALNGNVVAEIRSALIDVEDDPDVSAVVLTGAGKFFSFGFDIPEFLSYSRGEFTDYLTSFTALYTFMFTFSKPIVAALNGHTIAGGCMLALACDRRLMVDGSAKISMNEITFGSTVFAGSTEMLRFCVGDRNAGDVLYSGRMYSPGEAEAIGLVDRVVPAADLTGEAGMVARDLGEKPAPAFSSIKKLLRTPVAEEMRRREAQSITEFVDIWYSRQTWSRLEKIEIR